MKYEELIEVLNKDLNALEQLSGHQGTTVKVFEEEKEMMVKLEKEREKVILQTKKVVYPFYMVTGIILTLIYYGQYQQDLLIKNNEKKLMHLERVKNYSN